MSRFLHTQEHAPFTPNSSTGRYSRLKMKQNLRVPKVQIVNFPTKDMWDKVQIVVTILSLMVAIISLVVASIATYLYVDEVTRTPDIYLSVDSPTPILGKTIFRFENNKKYSNDLKFHIGLQNKGRKNSEYLNNVLIVFDKRVKVEIITKAFWAEKSLGSYKAFSYQKPDVVVIKDTLKHIGAFKINIPRQEERLLMASFHIEGDFEKRSGLIYYDYTQQQYIISHSINHEEIVSIWNDHLDD